MSFCYNRGSWEIAQNGIDNLTLKAILVTPDYADVANRDDTYISQLNADRDPDTGATAELDASAGYVGGFGGSGRQALSGVTYADYSTGDRGVVDCNDLTWGPVTTSDQIGGIVIVVERTSDDDSPLLFFINGTGFPTDGGGLTAQTVTACISPNGLLQYLCNP